MIDSEKLPDALKAIHEIVLKSRILSHSFEGEDGELFNLLDGLEYLIILLIESEDSLSEYCNYLDLLLREHECLGAKLILEKMVREQD